MLLFFLEDGEDATWSGMSVGAGAHGRAADEDAVAINMHHLFRNAHQDHEWTARRKARIPPIFARFQRTRRLAGGRAFRVERRFFDSLGGGEAECDGGAKKS